MKKKKLKKKIQQKPYFSGDICTTGNLKRLITFFQAFLKLIRHQNNFSDKLSFSSVTLALTAKGCRTINYKQLGKALAHAQVSFFYFWIKIYHTVCTSGIFVSFF